MQIKVYTISFQFPRWLKKSLVFVGIPAIVLGIGAVVRATVPVDTSTISGSNVISAAAIKGNFDALASAVNALQTPLQALTASGSTTQTLTASTNGAYTGTYLDLPVGTWLVQGQASLATTQAVDIVRLGLYNDTSAQEISGSRSAATTTPAIGYGVAISTPLTPLTVSSTTRIRLYGYRNGSSTLTFGSGSSLISTTMATDIMRITAVKLSQ